MGLTVRKSEVSTALFCYFLQETEKVIQPCAKIFPELVSFFNLTTFFLIKSYLTPPAPQMETKVLK